VVFEYRSTLDAPNAVAVNHSAAGGEVQLRYEGGPGKWELSALSLAERDSAGRIVGVRTWMMTLGSLGCVSERYVFANTGVTTADIERRLPYADSPEHWRLEFHYDEVGELLGIDRLDDEGSSVIYRSARASQVREAERYLTGAIGGLAVGWARRQQDSPSAYALAVVYDPNASRPLPPALALGTAIDLQRLSGIERWRAPEFAVFDPEPDEFLSDDRFADACAIVNVDIQSTMDRGRPKALAESWAKQLRNIDWNTELGSSGGAIAVYAMELECDDLDAAVDRLIDAPTRARVESE
jgi:hypothetical protein